MIHVRLADRASHALSPGSTGADLARAISPSLAAGAVMADVDGQVADLSAALTVDGGLCRRQDGLL